MSDYITLLGAENVASAGHRMAGAAQDMERAATSISETFNRFTRVMDDYVGRIERAIDAARKGERHE